MEQYPLERKQLSSYGDVDGPEILVQMYLVRIDERNDRSSGALTRSTHGFSVGLGSCFGSSLVWCQHLKLNRVEQ